MLTYKACASKRFASKHSPAYNRPWQEINCWNKEIH